MASDAHEIVIFIDPDVFFSQGLQGPDGPAGQDGSTWYNGSGAPDNADGIDGDYYIDNDTGEYYEKIAGAWVSIGFFQGTNDHGNLTNRDFADSHPATALSYDDTEHTTGFTTVQDVIDFLLSENAALAARVQTLEDLQTVQNGRLDSIEAVNTTQQTSIDDHETRISNLEGENTAQQTSIDDHEARITTLETP